MHAYVHSWSPNDSNRNQQHDYTITFLAILCIIVIIIMMLKF